MTPASGAEPPFSLQEELRTVTRRFGLEPALQTCLERTRSLLRLSRPSRIPLHRSEGFAPFFIVGSGRAGTTLLRRILQGSDEIHIPPEIWTYKDVYYRFLAGRVVLDWDELAAVLVHYFLVESQFGEEFKGREFHLIHRLAEIPEDRRSLARVIDTINREHGRFVGAEFTRWGDKTPGNFQYLRRILQIFPDARFIHLIRDGIDVVYSFVNYDLRPNLEVSARRWRTAVTRVREFEEEHPGRVHTARYEDLVRAPRETVRDICRFIDLDYDALELDQSRHHSEMSEVSQYSHYENVFEPITDEHIGKGRRQLTHEQLTHLDRMIGDDLERLGYDRPL